MICVLENALKTVTLCAVHWIHTSRSASAKMQQSKSVTDRTCARYGIGRCGNMQELMEKIHSLSRLYLYIWRNHYFSLFTFVDCICKDADVSQSSLYNSLFLFVPCSVLGKTLKIWSTQLNQNLRGILELRMFQLRYGHLSLILFSIIWIVCILAILLTPFVFDVYSWICLKHGLLICKRLNLAFMSHTMVTFLTGHF